ncbi:ABC transporter ATP-binding protein [Microbacterium sp.]|uniref:ABC transporter ATP-binding protein n=1 Tax=Microbacterium sp. TaxID=51671 RepID=UPI003C732547
MTADSPRSAGSGTVLDVAALTIGYRNGSTAVEDVSFTVGAGEIVGMIGESGSGKSSVAMATLGLLPDSARVEAERLDVAGTDILDLSERELCAIRGSSAAMVFQEPMTALNPLIRIGEQISETLRVHGERDRRVRRARALELLRLVRMPDPERRIDHYPHQLSGGQRQRVVIAIAMAAHPRLLVADEPTTALDVTVQADVLDLIRDLRDATGMGVLFISHDLGVITELCDRVLVMLRGRVVEEGPAASILAAPNHPYTQALLESIPRASIPPRTPLRTADFVR